MKFTGLKTVCHASKPDDASDGDRGFSAGPFQCLQHEDAPHPIIHENEAMNGHSSSYSCVDSRSRKYLTGVIFAFVAFIASNLLKETLKLALYHL